MLLSSRLRNGATVDFQKLSCVLQKRWEDSHRMVLQMQLGARPFQSEHLQNLLFLFEVQILEIVNNRDISDSG